VNKDLTLVFTFLISLLLSSAKGGKGGKGGKCGKAPQPPRKPQSRSSVAGLQFPVGRSLEELGPPWTPCSWCHLQPYTFAILESTSPPKFLELAGNACKDLKVEAHTPRHLQLATVVTKNWTPLSRLPLQE
jgi:histone H2A